MIEAGWHTFFAHVPVYGGKGEELFEAFQLADDEGTVGCGICSVAGGIGRHSSLGHTPWASVGDIWAFVSFYCFQVVCIIVQR